MSSIDVLWIIAEVLGFVALVGGGILYLARQVWRVLEAVDSLSAETAEISAHVETANGQAAAHLRMDDVRFAAISVDYGLISNRLSHIEGRLGVAPHDTPVI